MVRWGRGEVPEKGVTKSGKRGVRRREEGRGHKPRRGGKSGRNLVRERGRAKGE